MIPRLAFGRTGHDSTRTLFGAAALGGMRQEKADQVLALLLDHGVNHIDTAASYGDSELRIGPWMKSHRNDFFLATKTGERTYEGARGSIRRSLERLRVEHLDLIQFHNLVDEEGWQTAMGSGGALEAAVEARDEGLVRYIGVTGHGTTVAEMHLRSLEQFDFDSVLLPYNYSMMQEERYAREFEQLVDVCLERQVAIQTIKAIARRRWQDPEARRFSWYEPLRDPDDLKRAVHWVLQRAPFFLNTSSDATLLPATLDAATEEPTTTDDEMSRIAANRSLEPLFVRGVSDAV